MELVLEVSEMSSVYFKYLKWVSVLFLPQG